VQLISPNGLICYPAIEQCLAYNVGTSSYTCSTCSFGYEVNKNQNLCISASYNILGYISGSGSSIQYSLYGFGVILTASGYSLQWSISNFSSSSYVWYLTGYGNNIFTMRVQMTVNGIDTAFYIKSNNNGGLVIQEGFSLDDSIKWRLVFDTLNNGNIIKIQTILPTGCFINSDLTCSMTPTIFYFK